MLGLSLGLAEQRECMLGLVSSRPIPIRSCAQLSSFCLGILICKNKSDRPCSTQNIYMEGDQSDLCATSWVVM